MKESIKKLRMEFIPESKPVYKMLRRIVKRYHKPLRKAKIALVWRSSLKPDRDGHLLLGRCIKISDLYKEFINYDFIILLNKDVWSKLSREQQKALIDHEVFHAAPVINKKGKLTRDERGRYCFRTRRHEIEEFSKIVERHGCYLKDLELFAEALLKRRRKENGK